MKKRKMSFTSVGGSSILTIFAVLCFIVFALLSLSTAKADYTLAEKSVSAVSNYYQADMQAEEILAQIRQGQVPDGVVKEGNRYSYACPVDKNQQLTVEVECKNASSYRIIKWRKEYTGECKPDEKIEVWDGMEEMLSDS